MKPYGDHVVVITGASSGIGRATAVEFAKLGSKGVCAARGTEALDSLVAEIAADGGEALAVPTDVTDAAQVYQLAERAEQRFGAIDTWVNNAAVSVYATVEDTTNDEFERIMRVNFLGHVYGVH